MIRIVLCVALSLIPLSLCAVQIQSGRFANTTYISPRYFTSFKDFGGFDPVTGYMTTYNASDVSGKIVLAYSWISGPLGLNDLQNRGAIAAVVVDWHQVTGGSYCLFSTSETNVTMPIVEITYAKGSNEEDTVLKFVDSVFQGDQPLVTIAPDDNLWRAMYTSTVYIVLFRAMLGAIGLGLIIFAAVKMAFFLKIQGSQFNVPQVCLALEIIGNLIRVIWLAVDPFGCEGNFGYAAGIVLESLSIPFNLSTFMLITFYWYEAITDASIQIYAFLNKLKVAFFVVTIVIIVIQVVLSILAIYATFNNIIPLSVIFIVISVGFLVFYIITAVQISKRIRKALTMTVHDADKLNNLKTVTRKMIFSGAARVAVIIVGVVYAALNNFLEGSPINRVTIWSMIYVALYLDSFARIYLFDTKRIAPKKSSGGSTTNNSKSLSSKVSRTDLTSPEN